MCKRSLLGQFFCVTAITFLVVWLPLFLWKGQRFLVTPFVSFLISFSVILFAYYLNQWAFQKSNKVFFRALVGGMVARIVIVVALIFLVWRFFHFSPTLFLVSLIAYYLIFQIMEARFLQKQMQKKPTLSK